VAGFDDPAQCGCGVAAVRGDQAESASRAALPARIAQLQRQGMCMLVRGRCRVDPAFDQIHIREQCLGQWHEGGPAHGACANQSLAEALACLLKIVAQQMDSSGERPHPRLNLTELSRLRQTQCFLEGVQGVVVATDVCRDHALNSERPSPLG
jgi:hypothetical protein